MSDSITLFCIPFAGGNAYSYRTLEQRMNPAVRIVSLELPGRGRRSNETRVTCLHEMALDLLELIRPSLGQRYALFGHSMGALLAYLVTCQLVKEHLAVPQHLIISGKGPPHLIISEAPWHALPIEDFKVKLAELGGCPAAVLADEELMAYFAPIIRDDMQAIAAYQHNPAPPLNVPITVMIGTAETTTRIQASKWNDMTTSGFRLVQFEGGHFFLYDHIDAICALTLSTLVDL